MPRTTRRPTKAGEAKAPDVRLSRADEAGPATATKAGREGRWKAANRAAMESWAEPLDRLGLPLARHRTF